MLSISKWTYGKCSRIPKKEVLIEEYQNFLLLVLIVSYLDYHSSRLYIPWLMAFKTKSTEFLASNFTIKFFL